MSSLLVALLAVLVLALKRAFELVLEKEYATWAPALARQFVTAAGLVYWPRREQWEADLCYLQQVEGMSGLLPAGWCLLSAPGLLLRHVAAAVAASCGRRWEQRPSVAAGVLMVGVMGTLIVGPELVRGNTPASVFSAGFRPDGKVLATGGTDGTVRLWDVGTGKPYGQPITGDVGLVLDVASTGGQAVGTGGGNTVRLWDVRIGNAHAQPLPRVGGAYQFSSDGTVLVTGSIDGTMRLWDAETGKPYGQPLAGAALNFQLNSNGKLLATGGGGVAVRLWDVATGKPQGEPLAGAGPDFKFSPDGKLVATGGDGPVRLWDVATGKPQGEPLSGGWSGLEFSPDGKLLATGSNGNSEVIGTDGKLLATASNATVQLWEVATGTPHGKPLTGVGSSFQFSPDGKVLAIEDHAKVRLWDVMTGEARGEFLTGGAVGGFKFSPDGKLLAFPSADGTVVLWDLPRQRMAVLGGSITRPGAMGIMTAGLAVSLLASVVAAELPRLIARIRLRSGQYQAA